MKLLLLVQSEADVNHLDAAARAILNTAIKGVWCVFSPAITVNSTEAAAKLDAEIAGLKKAEREAAERSDYNAAAGYKTQREGKELDRAKALRDAHKTASAEEKQARTKAIFAPFIAHLKPNGLDVRITGHSDHYDREQWVAMLNSLTGVWFKEFKAGEFIVAWPESVEMAVRVAATPTAAAPKVPAVTPATPAAAVPLTRRQELEALHPMKLSPLLRSLGLDGERKTRAEKIDMILDRESAPTTAPAQEPALAEY